MTRTTDRLMELAASIRECYCEEYRSRDSRLTFLPSTYGRTHLARWDGGVRRGGRRTRSVWAQVAAFVVEHELDHQVLIRAVFRDRLGEGLTPLALMTAEALRLYAAALTRDDDLLVETARDGRQPRRRGAIPTGFSPLDTLMDGGWVPGEVYRIDGASGSGKTTLATQLLYQGALAEEEYAAMLRSRRNEVYQPGHWFLFHYSEGGNEMRNRLISHAAVVDRDSFDAYHPVRNPLSSLSNLKEYELELFRPEIEKFDLDKVDAEKERIEKVRKRLNERIHLIDMSCPPEAPTRGTGGPQEIAAILNRGKKEHGFDRISGVLIDHVGLCARRHSRARGGKLDYLGFGGGGDFGDWLRRLVAAPYGCCVWCMHQFNGEANKMSPHKPAAAAGARNFAENMSFAFALGFKHEESSCCLLSRSKSPRAGSKDSTATLVRLERSLARFVSIPASAAAE